MAARVRLPGDGVSYTPWTPNASCSYDAAGHDVCGAGDDAVACTYITTEKPSRGHWNVQPATDTQTVQAWPQMVTLSRATAATIQARLEEDLLREEALRSRQHRRSGIVRESDADRCRYELDKSAVNSLSKIVREQGLSVSETARLLRGETATDSRPNKALDPERLRRVLDGYPHLQPLIDIVTSGVTPEWRHEALPDGGHPPNHNSCRRHLRGVTRSLREGQDAGQYMVVAADILQLWTEVQCSPLGAVEKRDVDPKIEVRTIHDLSFPAGRSVNDAFVKESAPETTYQYVTALARRIEYLAARYPSTEICLLKGDVKGAFRHLMTNATHVHHMGAFMPELDVLVIDLAAPFGWSGSPPFYCAFGRAITWLVSNNSPSTVSTSLDSEPFFGYEWVDDHILIEPRINDRTELAEATLRHAMLAVLGPRSINEAKFSSWDAELTVLGLKWDTRSLTVSIPRDKIQKCIKRVAALARRESATKTELLKVLGSLRHISVCLPTVRPFYQQLHSGVRRARRFCRTKVTSGMAQDLQWLLHIMEFGHFDDLPLAFFGTLPEPDVHLYMDASNVGLAVLHPARDEFIQVQFDDEELAMIEEPVADDSAFSINVREHLCIALAVWTWGASWQTQPSTMRHIRCWSDNASAVSWSNKQFSPNVKSQEVNRAIGLAEALFNVRVSAAHLPGASNTMADAASRAWSEPHSAVWTNLSMNWRQVDVPAQWRKLYKTFSKNSSPTHWPCRRAPSTQARGCNGARGVHTCVSQSGCREIATSTRTNWPSSPRTAGNSDGHLKRPATQPAPCSLSLATSRGIISGYAGTGSDFSPDTNSPSLECGGATRLPPRKPQSQSACSEVYTSHWTSKTPTPEFCGGLRSWASSFFSGDPSISRTASK